MLTPDKDQERIIPRKRINFLKIGTQALVVVFLLLYISFDLLAEMLPVIPQISYNNLIIILLVMIFVMPLTINLFSKWLQSRKWLALAEQIGFKAEQANRFSMPTLHGTLRGHQVSLSQSAEHRGRNRVYFTNLKVELNEPGDKAFVLSKRTMTNFSQNKIGDDEIDKRYTVKTPDERLLNSILRTRRLRLGLLQIGERSRSRSLVLNHTTLAYTERGEIADTEYLQAVMGFLSEMAHTIERFERFN